MSNTPSPSPKPQHCLRKRQRPHCGVLAPYVSIMLNQKRAVPRDDRFSNTHQSGGAYPPRQAGQGQYLRTPLTEGTSFLMPLQVSTPLLSTTATCGTVVVT